MPTHSAVFQQPGPELNPIENLWHYLKSHFWSNRAYADYNELEQAAIDAWRQAVVIKDDCPTCGKRSARDELLATGCPWCGWVSARTRQALVAL